MNFVAFLICVLSEIIFTTKAAEENPDIVELYKRI